MNENIVGTLMPVLELTLAPEETAASLAGELGWMSSSIEMTTTAPGGFFGGLKRLAAGAAIFMTQYTAKGAPGLVSFVPKIPGHIVGVDISPTSTYMVHRHGFLAATPDVTLSVGFQRSLGAGLFGGDGFILQQLTGNGRAWFSVGGEAVHRTLAAGENLRVHPGHVGAFSQSVTFELTTVKGLGNILLGGDLFLASLTGPGDVWLQGFSIPPLAHAIIPYLPQPKNN
jgi:uncharacterized protein (TIGR00266 family)